eukprot:TRINITY_DN5965_c0_g1_i1.p1 TRINITY_DN5965_c0_g1~~TRINITY_DN5965_c0_g1_i1.p1  ORF type:complete len:505 (-),score=199.09 TRINITY_DN5965_c0_g1_i1:106-1620(-)
MSRPTPSLSIVEYFAEHSGYRCGYCKQEDTNFSHGMWGHTLTTRDYQDLIDRGWRRSGQYCYKPTMARTCCPLYTIKCDVVRFKPSKSQKKVIKKFVNYVLNDKRPGTGMSDTMGEEEGSDQVVVGERGEEDKGMHFEKELGLTNLEGLERLNEIEKDVEETTAIAPTLADNCDKSEEDTKPVMEKAKHLAARHVAPPKGMDPTKPRQEKAKLARREKWEKKVKEGKVDLKKKEQQEKTVEELLDLTNTPNPAHTFTKRLVKADEADPDFISSFSESLLVYQKYQMSVHGDKVDKCTDKQFRRFLCSSPLQAEAGLGSFHMQYLIDGRIVAVGVIDILPRCVSSVYLYYDPAFHFLSLGTMTSLMEICLVRELATTTHPSITSYYLGFYIHNCVKMRYKGRYSPSFLCCPETYTWHPLASCVHFLDLAPYSRLDRDMASMDRERPGNIMGVGVLYCRQATTYQMYKELVEEEGEERDSDRGEVEEYSMLVGDRLAKRMLLYRPA